MLRFLTRQCGIDSTSSAACGPTERSCRWQTDLISFQFLLWSEPSLPVDQVPSSPRWRTQDIKERERGEPTLRRKTPKILQLWWIKQILWIWTEDWRRVSSSGPPRSHRMHITWTVARFNHTRLKSLGALWRLKFCFHSLQDFPYRFFF